MLALGPRCPLLLEQSTSQHRFHLMIRVVHVLLCSERLAVPMTSGRWARIVVPISKQTSNAERLAGMHWFRIVASPSTCTVPARYNSDGPKGGLRITSDEDRDFYRLSKQTLVERQIFCLSSCCQACSAAGRICLCNQGSLDSKSLLIPDNAFSDL